MRGWLLVVLLICSACDTTRVSASMASLSDRKNLFPALQYTDAHQNDVDWTDAVGIEKLTSCLLLRFTRRGVRCVPSEWISILTDKTVSDVNNWVVNRCIVSNTSLCTIASIHDNVTYHSNVFPHFDEDVIINQRPTVDIEASAKAVTIIDTLRSTPCDHGLGREVLKKNGFQYDISACDLFDKNVDFVYDPVLHLLFVRQLSNDYLGYTITSVLVLVIVVFIAEELSHEVMNNRVVMQKIPSKTRMILLVSTWSALLISSIWLQFVSNRAHLIVTQEDTFNFWALFAYIMMYTVFWVVNILSHFSNNAVVLSLVDFFSTNHKRNHGINCMLATTFFAIQVLTGSSDNIYSEPFFFLFLYRMLFKLYSFVGNDVLVNGNGVHSDADEYPEEVLVLQDQRVQRHYVVDIFIILMDMLFLLLFFQYSFVAGYSFYTEALMRSSTFFLIANIIALVICNNEKRSRLNVPKLEAMKNTRIDELKKEDQQEEEREKEKVKIYLDEIMRGNKSLSRDTSRSTQGLEVFF
jgi:hypothetical protein